MPALRVIITDRETLENARNRTPINFNRQSLAQKRAVISAFESYERQAARLLEKYGGRIERVVRVREETDEKGVPFEFHLVSFPHEKRLAEYPADSERKELADSRDKIIARTETFFGFDADYSF